MTTALISAASSGLGFAIAKELVGRGDAVAICARDGARLDEARLALEKSGPGSVHAFRCDLERLDDIERWITAATKWFGAPVDKVVVNTGGPVPGRFDEVSDDSWHVAFNLVIMSTVRILRTIRPQLRRNASVALLTSSAVKEPIVDLATSTVLRAGISTLAKTLSRDWAPDVRVNHVVPGRFATDRVKTLDKRRAELLGVAVEDLRARAESDIPLGRYGDPCEFARGVAFLLSSDASYITGSTLTIDGGLIRGV